MTLTTAPQSGLILIDKPAGCTSHDVLVKLKRKLQLSKIGHTGTLDPMATGLLICLVGNATRLARFLDGDRKTYSGKIKLGLTTSSDDVTGETLTTSIQIPDFSEILQATSNFIGELQQIPPAVSAVKVGGQRSYDLARKGEAVELKARPVTVHEFTISQASSDVISFNVVCSRGTYIRSIARDLGALLGCGGCLKTLRREAVTPYDVSEAVTLDNARQSDIVPLSGLLDRWPNLSVSDEEARLLGNGRQEILQSRSEELNSLAKGSSVLLYASQSKSNEALGLLEKSEGGWKIALNFREDE
jgi:tRNA pseudouridine55 synthase